MSLTTTQKTKLAEIQAALNEVVEAYNNLKNLADKVERAGNDEELSLTTTQVNSLIGKYTVLREVLIDKAGKLPTL